MSDDNQPSIPSDDFEDDGFGDDIWSDDEDEEEDDYYDEDDYYYDEDEEDWDEISPVEYQG